MDHSTFNQYCSAFTGATHVVQWGNSDVWKVGGKVFAIGTSSKSGQPAFTFKTSPMNYAFLCDLEGYVPAPYFANRGMKWIQQTHTTGELDEDLKYYVAQSYQLVCQGLSKAKRAELGVDENSL